MTDWYKISASKSYKMKYNDKIVVLPEEKIISLIREKLKGSRAVQKAFQNFGIDIANLDELVISLEELDKKYALTDEKKMIINKKLFSEDYDFFNDLMFVPLHEIIHFLTRKKESKAYFNDEEESEGFILAIADYLSQGKSIQEVWRDVFPKIEWHFNSEEKAIEFFKRCIAKAKMFL